MASVSTRPKTAQDGTKGRTAEVERTVDDRIREYSDRLAVIDETLVTLAERAELLEAENGDLRMALRSCRAIVDAKLRDSGE